MGSDLAMRVLLPKETNAASSPTPGPSKTLGSVGARSLRKLASRSAGNLPADLLAYSLVRRSSGLCPRLLGFLRGFGWKLRNWIAC